jgi:hypothetical protein
VPQSGQGSDAAASSLLWNGCYLAEASVLTTNLEGVQRRLNLEEQRVCRSFGAQSVVRFICAAEEVHPATDGPAIGHTAENRSSNEESRFDVEVRTRSNAVADPVTSGSGSGDSLIVAAAGSRDGRFR